MVRQKPGGPLIKRLLIAFVPLLFCALAAAADKTRELVVSKEVLEYKSGDVVFRGYLAYPADTNERRPCVIVFPEWRGLNDYAKKPR